MSPTPPRPFLALLLAALLVGGPALAEEARPADLLARGEALLDQGDVEQAAEQVALAARAKPDEAAWTDRALVLRRVVSLRRFVRSEQAPAPWATAAVTLHAFYLAEDLPFLALDLDQAAHERLADHRSATLLAETLLVLRRNQEVVDLLGARSARTASEEVYRAIALARLGRVQEAKAADDALVLPADALAALLQDSARLKVLLGRWPDAFALLVRALEATPQALLEVARARVRTNEDFAAVRAEPGFLAALEADSKVASTCSGGSSCATCPKRGGCGRK